MGLIHSPSAVKDSMFMYYDASNIKSYPGSGTVAYDLSGNGRNGTLQNGVTHTGNAFGFDGVNQVIAMGAGSTFFPILPGISMETVFRCFGTVPTTGTAPGIFGLTYGIRLMPRATDLYYGLRSGAETTLQSLTTAGNYIDGSWYHVCCVAQTGRMALFVNGVEVASRSDNVWDGTTPWPGDQFRLGRDNNNVICFLWGEISYFRMYSRMLNPNEVSRNFNSVKSRFGL